MWAIYCVCCISIRHSGRNPNTKETHTKLWCNALAGASPAWGTGAASGQSRRWTWPKTKLLPYVKCYEMFYKFWKFIAWSSEWILQLTTSCGRVGRLGMSVFIQALELMTHCFKVSSGLVTNTSFLGSLLFSYRWWEWQIRFMICLQNDYDDSFVAQQCGGWAGPCGSCSVISLSITGTGSGSRGWFLPNMLVAHWEMSLHAQNKCNFPWGWSLALSNRCTLWTPPAPFCSETQL